jgi:carbamoyl-phosphate synthase large subunit
MQTIGITGVGGGVGQSIIKALQGAGYRLVGMDGEVLGTGLYAVDRSYKIPYAKDPGFIPRLLDICRDNDIRLLFPGLDAELYKFAENKEKFAAIGTTVMVSDWEVVDISENKWSTFEKLSAMGFNVPHTVKLSSITGDPSLEYPFILKPYLGGARSKDVYLIRNKEEYRHALDKIRDRAVDFILQEYLDGEEYTCGTVTLGGKCRGAILMKRELRFGDTYKCQTVIDTVAHDYLVRLMDKMQPFGACNVQMKLRNGIPYIFEINARCSGTTAARALCGFNEPRMVADYLLQGIEPDFSIREKTILRYWQELQVENDWVETLRADNTISLSSHPKL